MTIRQVTPADGSAQLIINWDGRRAALQAAIGAGNLRAYVPGQDDVGHAALANLGQLYPVICCTY